MGRVARHDAFAEGEVMSETSTPKTTKAAAEKATGAAADQASKAADTGAETVGKAGVAAKNAMQPMADAFDQIAQAQAEFAQRLGFDPKTFGFDPAKFGFDPGKFGFDPAKFGMDKSFGAAAPRFELLFAQHQKNVGAFFKAQAAMVDGVQTVFQRQLALFQQTLGEATSLMQALMSEKDSRIGVAKQVDASKKAFEKILAEAKELGDVVTKSQSEAFQLLNDRAMEQMEEIKAAYDKAA
jgi:phasin family protein